jgi:hypothetical protein
MVGKVRDGHFKGNEEGILSFDELVKIPRQTFTTHNNVNENITPDI